MMAPAIGFLSIGLWLGYLTISARAAPVLKAIAERSGRRGLRSGRWLGCARCLDNADPR